MDNVEARVRCLEIGAQMARAEGKPADPDRVVALAQPLIRIALLDNGPDKPAQQGQRRRGRPPKNPAAANPDSPVKGSG